MKTRKFYRCVDCGFIQEDALEMGVRCDQCGGHDWEFAHDELEAEPKFQVGDRVKIVRILDDISSRDLIGKVGTIQEVEPLPNGQVNYYMDETYVHEAELEAV